MGRRPARNAPCPCGSGKKYKHCCQRPSAEQRRIDDLVAGTSTRVLTWLHDALEDEVIEAYERLVGERFGRERLSGLAQLPRGLIEMFSGNVDEWLLVDGSYRGRGGGAPTRFRDRVLGPGGPLLDAVQREYLERMVAAPLRLYEVVESAAGVGLRLRDLTQEGAEAEWIFERAASKQLQAGEVIGARIVPGDRPVSSGAVYPFPPGREIGVQTAVVHLEEEADLDPAELRVAIAKEILLGWVECLFPPDLEIMDASTGEPFLIVTDHYRLRDLTAFEAALTVQPDVEGDPEEGWNRFEEIDGESSMRRARAEIRLGNEDRIEVVYQT
ncbi:MAG: SEC-C domain-containing protein, partial [Holophagales bacterium]|nr:SEC-C domain-containing protein [Holophagales bacterium]